METVTYRKSATPGVPPANASQKRLKDLRCCPLGRLVQQLTELDDLVAIAKAQPRPSMVSIAALMGVKFQVLKALLPYAYAQVPAESAKGNIERVPITICLTPEDVSREEQVLVGSINDALDAARVAFPEYKPH